MMKQSRQDRIEVKIDRELEDQIRKRLPKTLDVSQLIEKLLVEWLDSVDSSKESVSGESSSGESESEESTSGGSESEEFLDAE